MQGAMGDRLCWNPLAQRLQVSPVTPSLQGHWPVVWLHVFPAAPTGWQSHAIKRTHTHKDVGFLMTRQQVQLASQTQHHCC